MRQQRLRDQISDLFNPGRGGFFFFLGWVMLGLLGNAVYELFKDGFSLLKNGFGGSAWAHLGIAAIAAVIFGIIYVVLWARLNRPTPDVQPPTRAILLDYSHRLTSDQLKQISDRVGEIPDVRSIPVSWDERRPLSGFAVDLANAARLEPGDWQSAPLLIIPPGLASIASALMAEIHGRCGHWPRMVVMRRIADTTQYEVAEITNLQALRDEARGRR